MCVVSRLLTHKKPPERGTRPKWCRHIYICPNTRFSPAAAAQWTYCCSTVDVPKTDKCTCTLSELHERIYSLRGHEAHGVDVGGAAPQADNKSVSVGLTEGERETSKGKGRTKEVQGHCLCLEDPREKKNAIPERNTARVLAFVPECHHFLPRSPSKAHLLLHHLTSTP